MTQIHQLAGERIADLQRQRDAIDSELGVLSEIERLAAQLNGGGTVLSPAAETSRPAVAPPTQRRGAHAADPPSRKRASRSPRKTSARRAPAAPSSGASRGPAPAGDELVAQVAAALDQATAPLSRSAIVRAVGLPDTKGTALSNSLIDIDKALDRLKEQKRARVAGTVRGGGAGWAKATPPDENRQLAADDDDGQTNHDLIAELKERIVAVLREEGDGRQGLDIFNLLDPQPTDGGFGEAIALLQKEGRLTRVPRGGRMVFVLTNKE